MEPLEMRGPSSEYVRDTPRRLSGPLGGFVVGVVACAILCMGIVFMRPDVIAVSADAARIAAPSLLNSADATWCPSSDVCVRKYSELLYNVADSQWAIVEWPQPAEQCSGETTWARQRASLLQQRCIAAGGEPVQVGCSPASFCSRDTGHREVQQVMTYKDPLVQYTPSLPSTPKMGANAAKPGTNRPWGFRKPQGEARPHTPAALPATLSLPVPDPDFGDFPPLKVADAVADFGEDFWKYLQSASDESPEAFTRWHEYWKNLMNFQHFVPDEQRRVWVNMLDTILVDPRDKIEAIVQEKSSAPSTSISMSIGTSQLEKERPGIVKDISKLVNSAFLYENFHSWSQAILSPFRDQQAKQARRRVSALVTEEEIYQRLVMGDVESEDFKANRVLHLAFEGDVLVGCISSTVQPPWTEKGVGHWGFLFVHPDHRGKGIEASLIKAAEERLASDCTKIQVEFEYTGDEASAQHMKDWYEKSLAFICSPAYAGGSRKDSGSVFHKCHKLIPEDVKHSIWDPLGPNYWTREQHDTRMKRIEQQARRIWDGNWQLPREPVFTAPARPDYR